MAKTESELVDVVSKFVNDNGYLPFHSILFENKLTVKRDFDEFHGYKNFIKKHFPDMKPSFGEIHSVETKERMKEEVLNAVGRNGRFTVRDADELNESGRISFSRFQIYNSFGNWNDFLKYCGLPLNNGKLDDYSDDDLISMFLEKYDVNDVPTTMRVDEDYALGEFVASVRLLSVRFGSYNTFLKQCGLATRSQSWFNNFSVSKDGDLCNSRSELLVDDFFYDNDIPHRKEVWYRDLGIETKKKYRTDWVLEDGLVVEFCGMMAMDEYAIKMEEKEDMLITNDIPFVFLEFADLKNLETIFEKYIKKEVSVW